MKVLVTGGTGYIGSHTAVELIEAGHTVVICDNLSNSDEKTLDRIEKITGVRPQFYELDLTDSGGVHKLFSQQNDCSGVIHFAASKAVGESVDRPLQYYRNNLNTLINILDCMHEYGMDNFVFSSSCTVYGQPDTLPVTEETPVVKPESPYGNTKKIAEEIIADTVHAGLIMKAVLLRYFNPIGAHGSARLGELPTGVPDNLVPYITQTAYGIRDKLKVFGNDYDTRDGSCIRDYIHVVDLAQAHIVALERMIQGRNKQPCEVFNIGTGTGYTVLEAIDSFERVSGVKLDYEIVGRRPGDIEKIWADVSLSERELGWKAVRTLDEMMDSAWRWEKNYRSNTV
ncbi:MAG: UDP-glucose 4-epimerase GalE [Spirochaetota bacterium]